MTTVNMSRTFAALTAATLLVAGCSTSDSDDVVRTVPPSAASNATGVPQMSDQQAPPVRLIVNVTIEGGAVTPTNEQLQTKVGAPIVIRVNSDVADELHVHSNPEHSFKVEPKSGQSFQFTVEVPGRVDVELHKLNRTVATISVQ